VDGHIRVTAGPASSPAADITGTVTIARDGSDPLGLSWAVTPPLVAGSMPPQTAWTVGDVVTVTVDTGVTDAYQIPLAAPASGSFRVMAP